MYKLILISIVLIANNSFSQKVSVNNIPSAVTTAFGKQFPGATKITWEKEGQHEFEAEFHLNNVEKSASFDDGGRWLETETEMKVSELPAAVTSVLSKEFQGYKIDEADNIESAKYGHCYEAEIVKGKEKLEIILSPDGKVLKNSKDEESEEDD